MGYTDLALLMGQYPESAIYRRFSALNAENLLYLQAELVNLEKRYRKLKSTAVANDPEKINYDEDWYMLKHSGQAVPNDEVWTTFLEIRSKLKEYNEALGQQAIASVLEAPNAHDLKNLQTWLERSVTAETSLTGNDSLTWMENDTIKDLAAVRPRQSKDSFSDWLANDFLEFWYQRIVHQFKKPPVAAQQTENLQELFKEVPDKPLVKAADILTTVVSSVLPIAAVIVLYFVHNMIARLGIVAGFTALFSFTLAAVTRSRRVEIFTATAGFAAVLVVFVGSTSN